jgi:DNA-directed RNA polymerase specialized sigma24 family protein
MTTQGLRTAFPSPAAGWDQDRLAASLDIASRSARHGARRLGLDRADREDLRQDVLVILLERGGAFDPARGSWRAFAGTLARHAVTDRLRASGSGAAPVMVTMDLDALPAGSSATQPHRGAAAVTGDLDLVAAALPNAPRDVLRQIAGAGDLGTARREASQSSAAFYRALADLRCWLRAAGLRPTPTRRAPRRRGR